jgi:hypothetical protein
MKHDFTLFFDAFCCDPRGDHDYLLPEAGHDEYIAVYGKEIISYDIRLLRYTLSKIYSLSPHAHITLVMDVTAKDLLDVTLLDDLNLTVHFIPYWMLWTYCAHERLDQKTAQGPDPHGNILYMPGKLDKIHRVIPLQVLHKMGVLQDIKLSLHVPEPSEYTDCIQQVLNVWEDAEGYIQTTDQLQEYNNELDVNLDLHTRSDSFHLTGIPYDVSVFDNVSFTIISETNHDSGLHATMTRENFWCTEKTFRTIMNCMPFISVCAADPWLKELGFKTFEDLYDVPEVYHIAPELNWDSNWRWHKFPQLQQHQINLQTAIENMQTASVTHQEEIRERVLYNKNHMKHLCDQLLKTFDGPIQLFSGVNYLQGDFSLVMTLLASYANCNSGKVEDHNYCSPMGSLF